MDLVEPWPDPAYVAQGDVLLPRAGGPPLRLPPGATPSPDGQRVAWVTGAGVRWGAVADAVGEGSAPVAPGPAPSAAGSAPVAPGSASSAPDSAPVAPGFAPVALPSPPDARVLVAWLDERHLYLHATDGLGELDACWLLDLEERTWRAPRACLAHDFYAVSAVQRGPRDWWVVHSYGEGTPAVTVQRYDGVRVRAAPVPWQDLYPWGTVHASFVGDELWWTSDCDLTAPRPCAFRLEGDAEDPRRWRTYRWRPGRRAVQVVPGDVAPGTAWRRGEDGRPEALAPVDLAGP